MAAYDTTHSVTQSAGRVSTMLADLSAAFASWNDARRTYNELSKLSARELDDIGLAPGDIAHVANHK